MSKVRIARALLVASAVAAGLAAAQAQAQTGLQYFALTPCRAYDSRPSNLLPAGGGVNERKVTIKGVCAVPLTAKAVSLNATVATPTVDGFLSLWPAGGPFPVVSTLNFLAGEPAIANGAIVPLAAGLPDLSVVYGTAGGGTTHFILDITGYFQ